MKTFEESYRIAQLISKHKHGQLTTEETAELEAWMDKDIRNLKLYERWEQQEEIGKTIRFFEDTDVQKGWKQTKLKIQKHSKPQNNHLHKIILGSIAAAIIVFFGLSQLLQTKTNITNPLIDIATPNRYNVRLELPEGGIISLNRTSTIKSKNGTLTAINDTLGIIYQKQQYNNTGQLNTIIIPRGAEYMIALSDGSKVWLNSESKLKFPINFNSTIREVELIGEGYFEIAKDTIAPFIIKCQELAIQVTGTEFNITAYPEEKVMRTTVVKGAVNVYDVTAPNSSRVSLSPEQQAIYSTDTKQLTATKVNTKPFIAWHEGFICFQDESLSAIARKLERWYDITIKFDQLSTQDLIFYGSIKRHENIRQVLDMLKRTNLIDYTILKPKTILIRQL